MNIYSPKRRENTTMYTVTQSPQSHLSLLPHIICLLFIANMTGQGTVVCEKNNICYMNQTPKIVFFCLNMKRQ